MKIIFTDSSRSMKYSALVSCSELLDGNKWDVEFDVKNRNISIVFLYMKSKAGVKSTNIVGPT